MKCFSLHWAKHKIKPIERLAIGNPTFRISVKGDFKIQPRSEKSKHILKLDL